MTTWGSSGGHLPIQRPGNQILTATVTGTETPTPLRRRVWLHCPALGEGPMVIPGAWVRILVPGVEAHGHAGAGSPEVAMRTPRSYTVTQWNPAEGAFALEFVLHGGGPAALWAARAETGEELPLAGPMGRFMFPGGVQRILLAGDTTALPAIRELAASAPADAQVVAVVEAPASEQLDTGSRVRVKWTDPGELVRLAEAGGLIPSAWDPADPTISVWIAGEAHDAAATRFALLTMGVWPAAIHASAYWRRY